MRVWLAQFWSLRSPKPDVYKLRAQKMGGIVLRRAKN